nr:hypothetical protein [Tanacetum cinerariifolium]
MDPNSSHGKIFLGEDVVVILSDKVEGSGDWNSPEFQDTANGGKRRKQSVWFFTKWRPRKLAINSFQLCLEHKVKRGNKVVKKELIVALRGEIYFVKFIIYPKEDDVKPGVIFGRSFLRMTKAITDFGVGTITIYHDIDPFLEETEEKEKSNDDWVHLLDFNIDDVPLLGEEGLPPFEERPIIEKIAYHDKYKKILNEVWKDKVELDGKIVKEEEGAIKRIKVTGSDINTMPYQIYELGRENMKKVDRGITMINHTQAEAMGILTNVLCQVGVTTLIAKFLILDILIDRDLPIVVGRGFLQIDSDDEEDYQIKRNKFGVPIYGTKPTPYLNCNDPAGRSLAIETVTNPFWKISVWKKAVSFRGSLPVPLKNVNWKHDYKGSYTKEEEATGRWWTEIRLTDPWMPICNTLNFQATLAEGSIGVTS